MNVFDTEVVAEANIFSSFANTDVVGIATVLIAGIVAWIAYRNFLVSRIKIRHELFERRFEIYKGTQAFLSGIAKEGRLEMDSVPVFLDTVQKSKFLFGAEIYKYLDEIYSRSLKCWRLNEEKNAATVNERKEFAERQSKELIWLVDQLGLLHGRFGPYMTFDHK